jgi:hypothetical protein
MKEEIGPHIHQPIQRIWKMQKPRCVYFNPCLLLGYYPLSSFAAFVFVASLLNFLKFQLLCYSQQWQPSKNLAQRSHFHQ